MRINAETGLQDEEQKVMDALVVAAEKFTRLPIQHPDDQTTFVSAIHTCQDLLGMRVARRAYPKGWRNDATDL